MFETSYNEKWGGMDFGTWLAGIRTQKKESIRVFAQQIGIKPTTLQGIEKGRSDVTVRMAIQVCRGLNISVADFLRILTDSQEESVAEIGQEKQNPGLDVITKDEILTLTKTDEVMLKATAIILKLIFHKRGSSLGQFLDNDPRWAFKAFAFEGDHFGLLFNMQLRYPPTIELDYLYKVYLSGGALTLYEIGLMIRNKRKNSEQFRNGSHLYSLYDLQSLRLLTKSGSTLSRLETGHVEELRLNFLLELDEIFNDNFEIIKMYWNAPALENNHTMRVLSPRLPVDFGADTLLVLCRWLRTLYIDESWLEDLRTEMRDSIRSHRSV